jgi:hypothetical protein
MNPWQLGALADNRCRDIQREARSRLGRAPHQAQPPTARREHGGSPIRRQMGYLLVETGLRLLATARPATPEPRG